MTEFGSTAGFCLSSGAIGLAETTRTTVPQSALPQGADLDVEVAAGGKPSSGRHAGGGAPGVGAATRDEAEHQSKRGTGHGSTPDTMPDGAQCFAEFV
jgi:hypothetical protein